MDGERERANVATCDFAVLLRPEAVESVGECCLEVDGVWDSFWEGFAVSGEVDRPVAGKEAQSEKGCRKTLDNRSEGGVLVWQYLVPNLRPRVSLVRSAKEE